MQISFIVKLSSAYDLAFALICRGAIMLLFLTFCVIYAGYLVITYIAVHVSHILVLSSVYINCQVRSIKLNAKSSVSHCVKCLLQQRCYSRQRS